MLRRPINRFLRRTLGLTAPLVWRRRPSPSLVILTYHRILPAGHPARLLEQPGMYVSPETLAMHLQVLKEHFTLVDLGTWLSRRAAGDTVRASAGYFTLALLVIFSVCLSTAPQWGQLQER